MWKPHFQLLKNVPEAPRNRGSDPRIIPLEILMQAYAQGIFPMAESRDDPEMSKLALFHCHQVLVDGGFQLWDVQFFTRHLAQFGCREINAKAYRLLLARALKQKASFAGREGTM